MSLTSLRAGSAFRFSARRLAIRLPTSGNAELHRSAVAIGSEGRGLSRELLDICGGELIIPMNPHSESLNAAIAASVIMWEMSR